MKMKNINLKQIGFICIMFLALSLPTQAQNKSSKYADEYGKLAMETIEKMGEIDPNINLNFFNVFAPVMYPEMKVSEQELIYMMESFIDEIGLKAELNAVTAESYYEEATNTNIKVIYDVYKKKKDELAKKYGKK